jgi:class 3 adenylate cyclase
MVDSFPYELLKPYRELAKLGEWDAEVYAEFDALREGRLSEADFRSRHAWRVAILCLDMTGFTATAMKHGEIASLQRIYDVQRVCAPVFSAHGVRRVRAFADDLTAIFDDPQDALSAAFEVHRRIRAFNESHLAGPHPADCAIGIGYGDVFALGPDLAMGDEMNRASKLGEDTARGCQTLVTEKLYAANSGRADCSFVAMQSEALAFPFYVAVPVE